MGSSPNELSFLPDDYLERKRMEAEARSRAAQNPNTPPAKIMDVHMKLTGIADTDLQVAQFLTKLNQSRLLKDVNLVISDVYQQEKNQQMRKFQIEMLVNPAAEVREDARSLNTAAVEVGK